MAQSNLRSPFYVLLLGLFSLLLLIQKGDAFQFKVGGTSNWEVPPVDNTNTYNQWAERSRFQKGDSLLFIYPSDKDSVLYVSKDDYTNCNTEKPIQKFADGHTVFKLDQSGPHYFISGVKDNCLKNEKLVVIVMADRSNRTEAAAAPSPSNETTTTTAPPPSNETTTNSPPPSPSAPAPSGEESPSPPSPSVEINPTQAPAEQSKPHKNGASSILKGCILPLGAFIGSFLTVVL